MADTPMKLVATIGGGEEYLPMTAEEIEHQQLVAAQYAERAAEAERIAGVKETAKAKLIAGEPLTEEEAAVLVV